MHRLAVPAVLFVALMIGVAWCLVGRSSSTPAQPLDSARTAPDSGQPSSAPLVGRPIGNRPKGEERPQISHVAIVDLDRDGLNDVIVCDALGGVVSWIRQAPAGTFVEQTIAGVAAPAHVQAVDFDKDGDLDLVVAALGFLFPNNNRVGSVIVLENDGRQRFKSHYIADRVARVADARAADLDGDGDLDVTVAGFGYDDGETSWLENKGQWTFEQHVLQRLSGAINAIPADINGDALPDIVALVSQEWEEIWAFVNNGRGGFTPRMLWGSTNPDFGSSWMSMADLDRDGDADLLYANGDAFEYAPPNSRPWQGIQWLENRGDLRFELHRLVDLQGATSPEAADVDGDGDLDVLLVVSNNDWDNPQVPSLVWLENDGRMQFTMHSLASSPTHLLTLAVGDLDGDGKSDAVTGGMHISRPYDRIGRVTAWLGLRGTRTK
ncbi:MAG TPA: VCBS repeat-containing protein [Vicinamibacterales bacterium]|nr:VCBS repeat-containing protein [Vicinamibacterales bacterium]